MFGAQNSGFSVYGSRVRSKGFGFIYVGFRFQGLGFRV